MSLELALKENTETMRELIAAWNKMNFAVPPTSAAPAAESAKVDAKKSGAAATTQTTAPKADVPETKTQSAEASGTTQNAAASSAPREAQHPFIKYAEARELVLKLAAAHRDAIKAINTKHGIAKLSALLKDENDFDSVIDQGKLEAVYADLKTLAV